MVTFALQQAKKCEGPPSLQASEAQVNWIKAYTRIIHNKKFDFDLK
jgi:hypothetical protein